MMILYHFDQKPQDSSAENPFEAGYHIMSTSS
uniref:Uncharacterized protein n=1 Tax=Rhizophora mucronata TaxID=61149 RepID=A0A2P2PM04_RHIMU